MLWVVHTTWKFSWPSMPMRSVGWPQCWTGIWAVTMVFSSKSWLP
jgi:hypothetical protein